MNLRKFKDILKSKIVISILVPLIVATITTLVTFLAQKEDIDIVVNHYAVDANSKEHMYILEITNNSFSSIMKINLGCLIFEQVMRSTFDGMNTTHILKENQPVYFFSGDTLVHYQEKDTTLDVIFKLDTVSVNLNSKKNLVIKKEENQEQNTEKIWYDLSLGQFSLKRGETKLASIYLSQKIEADEFNCKTDNEIFIPSRIKEVSSTIVQSIISNLSANPNITTNKIYVEGIGKAKENTFEQSRIVARNHALENTYKEVVQRLYGIKISSLDQYFFEEIGFTESDSTEFELLYSFNCVTKLECEGKIDRQALIVYGESFNELSDGAILCVMKAFYKLPWDIVISDNLKPEHISDQKSEPISEFGAYPDWFGNPPIDDNYIYGTGICSQSHDRSIGMRIAVNNAIAEMARNLEVRVSTLTKRLFEENVTDKNVNETFTSASKFVVSRILQGLVVNNYYFSNNGDVFALVSVPSVTVEEKIQEAFEDFETRKKK